MSYLETSALLRAVLERDAAALERLVSELASTPVTSALTFVEAIRAIRRGCAEGRFDREREGELLEMLEHIRAACAVFALDEPILARAEGTFPVEPIRTLDALHVATAAEVQRQVGDLEVLSSDHGVRDNVRALGMRLADASGGFRPPG